MTTRRTPTKQKARELAKYLRSEHPDYSYLKQLFQELRAVLEITVPRPSQRLPDVPSDEEIRRYYEVVWRARNFQDMVLVKTLLYRVITNVRAASRKVNIITELARHSQASPHTASCASLKRATQERS